MNNSTQFQHIIGYTFKDMQLLDKALTHSSYVKETGQSRLCDNERLEFLGDAFLDAIIGEELYRRLPKAEEGILTKARASIVCEKSLAAAGRKLSIGEHMLFSRGEEKSGGRDRDSILADGMEAVIGAIYLDGGYEEVRRFVVEIFQEDLQAAGKGKLNIQDYKSEVQEQLQGHGILDMHYVLEKEEGPDHNKVFSVRLEVLGKPVGYGKGKSKKLAEQNAAKDAMERGIDVL
ncbi:ribonuclease III [Anaerovorax odorimutans]|uniref:Ribonuclease 3 n=1 Tax=Anaerovorax odorimutans TaxID=109327 RepID=A0ABT1RK24_9FIRM|nr:ribonuclease III [Anaerovorax odorimutans]